MSAHWKKLGWLLFGLLVGCGGIDFEYACEQELDCTGMATGSNVDLCVDVAEAFYDNLTDSEQDKADEAWEACEDEKGCDYVACIDAETGG